MSRYMVVHTATWGHDVWPVLLLRAMSRTILLQLVSGLKSVAYVTREGHRDAHGQGYHLRPR